MRFKLVLRFFTLENNVIELEYPITLDKKEDIFENVASVIVNQNSVYNVVDTEELYCNFKEQLTRYQNNSIQIHINNNYQSKVYCDKQYYLYTEIADNNNKYKKIVGFIENS